MKNYIYKLLLAGGLTLYTEGVLAQSEDDVAYPKITINLEVSDEKGNPIEQMFVAAGGLPEDKKNKTHFTKGFTDSGGKAALTFRAAMSDSMMCEGEGWYKSRQKINSPSPFKSDTNGKPINKATAAYKEEIIMGGKLVARKVINPIPLCAKNLYLTFPEKSIWLSYDLEVGDWLPPHGKGKTPDLKLKSNSYSSEVSSEKNASLEIDFGKGGGVIEVSHGSGYLPDSAMKMPHHAPTIGYNQSTIRKEFAKGVDTAKALVAGGYFFRTRVEKENDRVVSAHYGKILNRIEYTPIERVEKFPPNKGQIIYGCVRMTYYFNPTPNDINLEFDTSSNILTNLDSNVINP